MYPFMNIDFYYETNYLKDEYFVNGLGTNVILKNNCNKLGKFTQYFFLLNTRLQAPIFSLIHFPDH